MDSHRVGELLDISRKEKILTPIYYPSSGMLEYLEGNPFKNL